MEESAVRELIADAISPIAAKVKTLEDKAEDVRVWQAENGVYIKEIRETVKGLIDKPQKRWDAIVYALIAAIVSGVVAYFIH